MRKYFVLLLFIFFLSFFINSSYAYPDCNNYEINPVEVSTLNLKEYLNNVKYRELIEICSYDRCYKTLEDDIDLSINRFNIIYYNKLNEEEKLLVDVRGYPITKLVIDNCSID